MLLLHESAQKECFVHNVAAGRGGAEEETSSLVVRSSANSNIKFLHWKCRLQMGKLQICVLVCLAGCLSLCRYPFVIIPTGSATSLARTWLEGRAYERTMTKEQRSLWAARQRASNHVVNWNDAAQRRRVCKSLLNIIAKKR
jgi:hypothetical protein